MRVRASQSVVMSLGLALVLSYRPAVGSASASLFLPQPMPGLYMPPAPSVGWSLSSATGGHEAGTGMSMSMAASAGASASGGGVKIATGVMPMPTHMPLHLHLPHGDAAGASQPKPSVASCSWTACKENNKGALTGADLEKVLWRECVDMYEGNQDLATQQYQSTSAWRRRLEIDTVLSSPFEDLEFFKQAAPLFLCGRARDGGLVSYKQLGRMDCSGLRHHLSQSQHPQSGAAGLEDGLAKYVALHTEYVRAVLNQHQHNQQRCADTLLVLDFKGVTLASACSSTFIRMTQIYAETLVVKQPFRLGKVLVVNPPLGVKAIKRVLFSVLPKRFRDRLEILDNMSGLTRYIDPHNLPTMYGGSNNTPLSEWPEERGLRELIHSNRRTATAMGNGNNKPKLAFPLPLPLSGHGQRKLLVGGSDRDHLSQSQGR